MKVAYISPPYFSDVDISFINEMKERVDVDYYIPVYSKMLCGAAINIEKQYPKSGIFKASIYAELVKYKGFIDLDRTYVMNKTGRKSYSLQNLLVEIAFIIKLIRKKYDIIHITETPYYYEFLLYFLRKKIVLTVHDPVPHSCFKAKLMLFYRRVAFKFLNCFIVLNKAQRDEFVEANDLQGKNVFDSRLSTYNYLSVLNHSSNSARKGKYILYFGQIQSHKGLDYLFPAMEIVHNHYPDIDLVAAGKGDYYFEIAKYKDCGYFDIQNRFIPDGELACLIKNALFVVCPYIDATQSGVIMSAYAFNKPVLATNVGGLPEMVEHNKSGIIVPPKDTGALASGILSLLHDEGKLSEMESYIKEKYEVGVNSWKSISRDMAKIYQNISGR